MGHLQACAFFAACSPQGQQRAFSDKEPATGRAALLSGHRDRPEAVSSAPPVKLRPTDEAINQSDGLFRSV